MEVVFGRRRWWCIFWTEAIIVAADLYSWEMEDGGDERLHSDVSGEVFMLCGGGK